MQLLGPKSIVEALSSVLSPWSQNRVPLPLLALRNGNSSPSLSWPDHSATTLVSSKAKLSDVVLLFLSTTQAKDLFTENPGYQLNVRTNKHIDMVSNMASSSHPISIQASHDLLSTSNIEPAVTGDVGFELSTIPPETSKTPKRCPTVKIAEERPEWLPEGWSMEARERTSMKWKGVRDRYYYDPMNHQRFRSKKEVERFLKMETVKKYETKSMEVEPTTDNLQSTLRFDFNNPPAKVSWVLSNFAEGVWTPYINNEEVSESTRNSWVTTMEGINNSANRFQE